MDTPEGQLQIQTERVASLLNPHDKAVLDNFRQIKQSQSRIQEQKQILEYASQQLKTERDPSALTNAYEGVGMYETESPFDRKAFLSERVRGKVLDIGSGGHDELERVVPDEQIIYLDKERFNQKNFVQGDASKLPFGDKTMDTVYSSGAINEYQDARELLPEMLRVIKKDGVIILKGGNTQEILETLAVFSELGIDIYKQVELTLAESSRKHKELPISLDTSSVYITIRLGQVETADYAKSFREHVLIGKSPQAFIIETVSDARRVIGKQKDPNEVPLTKYDVAYIVQTWINMGVITEGEVSSCLDKLGLKDEEIPTFISETLPEIREFMVKEQKEDEEEARKKEVEAAVKYCNQWGLKRLDGIADYFREHLKELISVNPNWGNLIERYMNERKRIEGDLERESDPIKKQLGLMKQLYYLAYFHPSESAKVFEKEQQSGSFVYLDSFMDAAKTMFVTGSGHDPDFDNIHFGYGEIGVTMMVTIFNDPESVKRYKRRMALENLVYGAKSPFETSKPWKRKISEADSKVYVEKKRS